MHREVFDFNANIQIESPLNFSSIMPPQPFEHMKGLFERTSNALGCVNERFGCLELVDDGRHRDSRDRGADNGRSPRDNDECGTETAREPRETDSGCADRPLNFDDRMRNFRERMYRGIQAEGQINDREAKRLNEGMVDLQQKYDEFKKGGLSPEEKKELAFDLKMQSLQIFHDRHDDDSRKPGNGYDRYDIEARLDRQHERTRNGVKNGSMTEEEFERTHRRLTNIEVAYNRMKNDEDGLTCEEREKLAKKLDMSSLKIFHDKHDRDYA